MTDTLRGLVEHLFSMREQMTDDAGVRRTAREWLALKLYQLSRWVHDTEWREKITVTDSVGTVSAYIVIVGNDYGAGWSSAFDDFPFEWRVEIEECADE